MKKLLTVVGARPQFIKAAPVSRALRQQGKLREVLVHTGQHFDPEMSDIFFDDLQMRRPDHQLNIGGGQPGEMTGRAIVALENVILAERPSAVLIYGDTNSTLAGAIAAAKLFIPVAHVEAGLRSFRPMQEEVNRVLADRVSRWLFCPTPAAVDNLASEGIRDGVHAVGDVMYDTTLHMIEHARNRSNILERLGLEEGAFDLATVHRAENTDDASALADVMAYLAAAAEEMPVVLPIHPRTQAAVARHRIGLSTLRVIDPVGFLDMTALLANCRRVLTDSGGLQKEAYFHRKPCVTLRDSTEWVETVEAGWNRLWRGPDYRPRREIPAYGDGRAAWRIAQILGEEA